jgi:hypothetical protein
MNNFGRRGSTWKLSLPGIGQCSVCGRVVTLEEIRGKDGNLSIPLYVATTANGNMATSPETTSTATLPAAMAGWVESSPRVRAALAGLLGKDVN